MDRGFFRFFIKQKNKRKTISRATINEALRILTHRIWDCVATVRKRAASSNSLPRSRSAQMARFWTPQMLWNRL